MTEPRRHRRVVRNRKKNATPLSKLRTLDAVKTVVDHPRRLEELLRILEDKDRCVRGRAAAALARLSESHPARLLRATMRLKESIADDSAYVRWHLVYTLGRLATYFPSQSRTFLADLIARLDDENRVVRTVACKALGQVATRKPDVIAEFFGNLKKEMPPAVARALRGSKTCPSDKEARSK
jgi:HEAT repeat protein